jgi:TonB family protein
MNRLLFLMLIVLTCLSLAECKRVSQNINKLGKMPKTRQATPDTSGKDTIFYNDVVPDSAWIECETSPEFPGGDSALKFFILNNTTYPPSAIKDSIQGKVVIRFVIDPCGKVQNIGFLKNARYDLDSECVRVIRKIPVFKPGTQLSNSPKGYYWHPASFYSMVLFYFKLHDDGVKFGIVILPGKNSKTKGI